MLTNTIKRLLHIVLVITLSLTSHIIWSADVVLFEEDFDDVELKDSIAEGVKGTNVWSDTGPDGWEITNENPKDLGMPEWRTFAIVKLEWWVQTAEDQERSQFTSKEKNGKGVGNGVVSDPDEWDDWTQNGDPDSISDWNGHIITPPINIQGAGANSLVLSLDSSWRPYDNQTAEITVSFDGNKEERILLFASSGEQTLVTIPTLNKSEVVVNDLEQTNESLEIPIDNPDGADEIVISFGLLTAKNDWWWAFDNVKLVSTAFVATDVQLKDKLTVKWAELKSIK
ncbi:hypothetical protein C6497_12755 [Candidatus Poribacteria bacterium]|nr:MAG: hypothetical protein C6497_12755 [Candidatus Poribacteria bacterium]